MVITSPPFAPPPWHLHLGTSPGKNGISLCLMSLASWTQTEELIEVIALEEPPLTRVTQNTIGEELLEDLPAVSSGTTSNTHVQVNIALCVYIQVYYLVII